MLRKTKSTEITPKSEEAKLPESKPFRDLYGWFDGMDRWFDDVRREFFAGPGLAPPVPSLGGTRLVVRNPFVDLVDEGRDFVVRAELPGVSKEDVDLDVTADGIEIRAEAKKQREEKEKDYYFQERRYEALQRLVPFPAKVLPDRAEATLKDGVLEVRVPKKEPTPERKPFKVRVE